jgi:uncharacterized protein
MTNTHHQNIASDLAISLPQVNATIALLAEGASIPFIARYRKEATGLLDETQVAAIRDGVASLAEIDKRRTAILKNLTNRELLSEHLTQQLNGASDLSTLEDIYLPYKQKRKTRAEKARDRGLEPLAQIIRKGEIRQQDIPTFLTARDIDCSRQDALAGARDIMAEWISEDPAIRAHLRRLFWDKAQLHSRLIKKMKDKGQKFQDYFDWQELARKAAGHRLLAMFRGEEEKILRLSLRPDEDQALALILRMTPAKGPLAEQITLAASDCYKRLLGPALEKELRKRLKDNCDKEAIQVFGENLRELLLAPALGQKRVMALDPGFRSGAKLVCLNAQGQLLHHCTIYPTHGGKQREDAGNIVKQLCQQHSIEAIAIGNGTASRETEQFVSDLDLNPSILVTLVNESGASIYSASAVARKEFPDHDITVRGAISIGRRLQDPLAELVKLDPKSIGVGQYQHDVNQIDLKQGLDDVVMSCVNSVGVEVNTASQELLTFVSGLGPMLATNIISHRQEKGPFSNRKQLKNVARLGAKAFEQCAGFLRIHGANNPLDDSAVHPEQYSTVTLMAQDCNCNITELLANKEHHAKIDLKNYRSPTLGLPSLMDIMAELAKPGRDPREQFSVFSFAKDIDTMDDLIPEMRLPGIVTNVTRFGAFVDLGVHQDGLIHISQLADRFIRDPAEIVKAGQQLTVRVLSIDTQRKRIALSLRDL